METIGHSEHMNQANLRGVIMDRQNGIISIEEMMSQLRGHSFTAGQYDPTGGDGFISGDWRVIESALTEGLLTDEEYTEIAISASGGSD